MAGASNLHLALPPESSELGAGQADAVHGGLVPQRRVPELWKQSLLTGYTDLPKLCPTGRHVFKRFDQPENVPPDQERR